MLEWELFVREAVEGLAFEFWLRTGSVPDDIAEPVDRAGLPAFETKGNPYHDPKDGRFTFAPGHAGVRRGYEGITKHGRGAIEPIGGGGTDRQGKPRPELFAPDPYALKSPDVALAHYMGRSGKERNFYLQNVDMSGLSIDRFGEMKNLVAKGKPGVYPIIDSLGSSEGIGLVFDHRLTSGAMIGGLSLHADGTLVISKTGAYRFSGSVTADSDKYDFNDRRGRSPTAAFSTTAGRLIPGVPFRVYMVGSKRITLRGQR